MKYEELFKKWLSQNGIMKDSIRTYISYINSLEKDFNGTEIDILLKDGIAELFDRIDITDIPQKSSKTISCYKAAIKKYWQFLNNNKSI